MTEGHLHEEIDRHAHTNPLSKSSPFTKLFFVLSALVICVSLPSPIVPLAVLSVSAVLILFMARIPISFFVKMLSYPTAMLGLSCIIIALFFGDGEALAEVPLPWFTWTIFKNGVTTGIATFIRVEGALSCLFFLVLTTPMTNIFVALRRIRIPAVLVEVSLLIYRYIFVFIEITEKMTTAQELRFGNSSWLTKIRSIGLISGNLFIRTMEQGERTLTAMNARGYDGTIRMLEDLPKPSKAALVATVLFDSILLLVSIYSKDLLVV
ncbi:MAG: cobalt ECF transporter T component CbiQ [Candidatus Verstraetearchaeota archaeon]|nr:cobalt ECF transporter T component CbiQ [Candidatus Verstraetearchaeota archaeon]